MSSAHGGMSVIACRVMKKYHGDDARMIAASHATRREYSRASAQNRHTMPPQPKRTNGTRMAHSTRDVVTISPENPPSSATPNAFIDAAMSQNVSTGLDRNASSCQLSRP